MIAAFLAKYASKLGVYVVIALMMASIGFYGGYRFEIAGVLRAKLALANQLTTDANVNTKAATTANTDMQAQVVVNDNQVAVHQGHTAALAASTANVREIIATQAATPGQDGPVAPVLANALAAVSAMQAATPGAGCPAIPDGRPGCF
ncbi:MAG: hypothetical protein B7Z80_18105 [Rhodospirillales bacterium 20-64-7]|nr:MAG: hypothetical protein B7Z80_18105 [Rhodospirillales bacterium 20-64-7]